MDAGDPPVAIPNPPQPITGRRALPYITIRIVAHGPSPAGVSGSSIGTGFIFVVRSPERLSPWIVTNRHVVEGFDEFQFFFHRGDPESLTDFHGMKYCTRPLPGDKIDINMKGGHRWSFHPDPAVDIAVHPIAELLVHVANEGGYVHFRSIDHRMIPSQEVLATLDAVEDVLFVGYPNGIYDEKNLIPIIRRGITATPADVDYEGTPCFLIDASVFPGSSGSPVLLWDSGVQFGPSAPQFVERVMFLGVVARTFLCREEGIIEMVPAPTTLVPIPVVNQMIDIGIVYKARTVMETILALCKQCGIDLPLVESQHIDLGDA